MRRLNYTGRVRIAHHHVHATGTFVDERPLVRVELDLATLNLDPAPRCSSSSTGARRSCATRSVGRVRLGR